MKNAIPEFCHFDLKYAPLLTHEMTTFPSVSKFLDRSAQRDTNTQMQRSHVQSIHWQHNSKLVNLCLWSILDYTINCNNKMLL